MVRVLLPKNLGHFTASPGTTLILGRSQLRSLVSHVTLNLVSRASVEITASTPTPESAQNKKRQHDEDQPYVAEVLSIGLGKVEIRSPSGASETLSNKMTTRVTAGSQIVLLPGTADEEASVFTIESDAAPPSPSQLPAPVTLGLGLAPDQVEVRPSDSDSPVIVVDDDDEVQERAGGGGGAGAGPSTSAPLAPVFRGAFQAAPRQQMLILIGLQGAGKSTFATRLQAQSGGAWVRVNQDSIKQGKQGRREDCVAACRAAFEQGKSVVVDRCNFDTEQRSSFIKVAQEYGLPIQCLMFQMPVSFCAERAVKRKDHEGGLEGWKAKEVVNRTSTNLRWPSAIHHEGMLRGLVVRNDVEAKYALEFFLTKAGGISDKGEVTETPAGLQWWNQVVLPVSPSAAAKPPAAPPRPSTSSGPPPSALNVMMNASRLNNGGVQVQVPRDTRAFSQSPGPGPSAGGRGGGGRGGGGGGGGRGAGAWADVFLDIVRNPERHDCVIETKPNYVVIADKFPKSRHHFLVLARDPALMGPTDLRAEHLPLLREMQGAAQALVQRLRNQIMEDRKITPSSPYTELKFKVGVHLVPSMRVLHIHVISQDFDSEKIKKKEHINSFATGFFHDLPKVIQEVESTGRFTTDDKQHLSALGHGPLAACPHCGVREANLPTLKIHLRSHA